jgi:hypothetical protein
MTPVTDDCRLTTGVSKDGKGTTAGRSNIVVGYKPYPGTSGDVGVLAPQFMTVASLLLRE